MPGIWHTPAVRRAPLVLWLLGACAEPEGSSPDVLADTSSAAPAPWPSPCVRAQPLTADGQRLQGAMAYTKRVGAESWVITPVRGATLVAGEQVVGATDDRGCFDVPLLDGIRAEARAALSHFDVTVVSDAGAWSWPVAGVDVLVDEPYAAGAFNALEGAVRVDLSLGALDPDLRGAPLQIRWGEAVRPACGSCFYFDGFTLELTGQPGDEDAHDDPVLLHELGHYVEAAFGTWSNPGGGHDLEPAAPAMAWSEGFATWFQAWLRGQPDYTDLQPSRIYQLDLEATPLIVNGVVPEGDPSGRLSEGLVYGLLWDLFDERLEDDDGQSTDGDGLFRAAVGVLGHPPGSVADAGAPGADLLDFLRRLACGSSVSVSAVTESFGFPWSSSLCP